MIWILHIFYNKYWIYWKSKWSGGQCLSYFPAPVMISCGVKTSAHLIIFAKCKGLAVLVPIYFLDIFFFCLIFESITTAHLSILMYCGYPQKDILSLIPLFLIYSTNANVHSELSNLESFQTMSSWTEHKGLDPLRLLKLKGTGFSSFLWLKR